MEWPGIEGLQIFYADGDSVCIGDPPGRTIPELFDLTKGNRFIRRLKDTSMSVPFAPGDLSVYAGPEEAGAIAHVTDQDEKTDGVFDLGEGGDLISEMRIWADKFIFGMQFVFESGKESPCWGKCGGKPKGVITIKPGHPSPCSPSEEENTQLAAEIEDKGTDSPEIPQTPSQTPSPQNPQTPPRRGSPEIPHTPPPRPSRPSAKKRREPDPEPVVCLFPKAVLLFSCDNIKTLSFRHIPAASCRPLLFLHQFSAYFDYFC